MVRSMSRIRMCVCFVLSVVRFQYVVMRAYVTAGGAALEIGAFLDEHYCR